MNSSRYQYRISYRDPKWNPRKPTAARLFRSDFIAVAFVRELEEQGLDVVAFERREYSVTPWQPYDAERGGN